MRIVFGIALLCVATPSFAGTYHWANGKSPQAACADANAAAKKRAKRIRTCVTTKCIPGTQTVSVGGPSGFQGYAVSANHRGSC